MEILFNTARKVNKACESYPRLINPQIQKPGSHSIKLIKTNQGFTTKSIISKRKQTNLQSGEAMTSRRVLIHRLSHSFLINQNRQRENGSHQRWLALGLRRLELGNPESSGKSLIAALRWRKVRKARTLGGKP